MDLDDRKLQILEAIVNDYILTAEPIGSRTIEKKYNLGISSATIRNEMSDLEELGLIIQPHASAGRIPSDKGYRLYVNKIMESKNEKISEAEVISEIIFSNINKIEILMEETAKALSLMTNYVTVVTEPSLMKATIKHIQLVPIDEKSILLVMVLNNNDVKDGFIDIKENFSKEHLNKLTEVLNTILVGKVIENIDKEVISQLINLMDNDQRLIKLIIAKIVEITKKDNASKVYTSGVNNILGFPEFNNNMEKAKEVFKSIEQKDFLSNILMENENENVEIIIGEENSIVQMHDFSVVKARYKISENRYGNIGIIGPTRMNYEQTINILNGIVKNINSALKSLEGD